MIGIIALIDTTEGATFGMTPTFSGKQHWQHNDHEKGEGACNTQRQGRRRYP